VSLLATDSATGINLVELLTLLLSALLTAAVTWGARTLSGLLKSNVRIEARLFGDNGKNGMVSDVELLKAASVDRELTLYGHDGRSGIVFDVSALREWKTQLESRMATLDAMALGPNCPHEDCPFRNQSPRK
jgi:hypothetical protein